MHLYNAFIYFVHICTVDDDVCEVKDVYAINFVFHSLKK